LATSSATLAGNVSEDCDSGVYLH